MKDCCTSFRSLAGLLMYTIALLPASTYAVTLSPGETVFLPGTTAISRPKTAGPLLEERVADFAVEMNGKTVTGAVSQRLRGFQGSTWLIDYRITSFDDQGMGLQIEGLNTQGFFGVGMVGPLDVDYRLDAAGDIVPVTASLQADGGPVEFDFGPNPLSAGETSRWVFIGDPNNDLVIFGDHGAHLLARDPAGTQFSFPFESYVTFIPSPTSLPLLAFGLIGLIGIAKRRVH